MTSTEAIIGLPNGNVTRTRSIARLIPSQRWRKDAVLGVKGVPAKPSMFEDDSVIESYDHPHLLLDDDARVALGGEEVEQTDLPLCLEHGRKLPSLRITQSDLLRYGYSGDCPRCIATQLADLSSTPGVQSNVPR